GETLQASVLPLPAATVKTMPELTAPATASFSAFETPPPRERFATAGLTAFCATQLTPAMTADVEPEPLQSSTRTATSDTPFATPYVEPPIVPATCVPCPLQSMPS